MGKRTKRPKPKGKQGTKRRRRLRRRPTSYSPSINRLLVSKRPDLRSTDIFGCGLESALVSNKRRNPKVKVGDGPTCAPWNSKAAKTALLNNLRASENFDLAHVVTPKQIDSNCWFNVFFVTFFISDKGRKFFRFFRELMIRGEHVDGRKIPTKIAHALFYLNACIEASYSNKNVALAMDTNHVVLRIYDSIRAKDIDRLHRQGLADIDDAGNPLEYYSAIMDYIGGGGAVRYKRIHFPPHIEALFRSAVRERAPPHLYIVEMSSNVSVPIPTEFRVQGRPYVLDASALIDTRGRHFGSTLMCGGKEMGFDGSSVARLEPFKWKSLLNKDKDWTFEGSLFDGTNQVWWNYRNGYKMLFYYRT